MPPVSAAHDLGDEAQNKLAAPSVADKRFTVTGSMIERTTLVTPAPLTILSRDDLDAFGRSMLGDILQQLPAQANGTNAQFNLDGDGSTQFDFRGLGSNRTLTLLNGRRMVSNGLGADTSIDLNAIPLAVIDRVEILKGGASAVYGSGAVGGVVNIITRADLDGTDASLYTAGAQRGGGFTYDASVITGHPFDHKKGKIIFSAGIQRQDPVFAESSLFNADGFASLSAGSSGGVIDAFSIDRDGDGMGDGSELCGPGVQYCTANPSGGYRPLLASDLYNDQHTTYLYAPSSRDSVYTTGSYEVRGVTGFFEASYVHRTSQEQGAPQEFSASIPKNSLYNPLGGDVRSYSRRLEELGLLQSRQDVHTLRMVGGTHGTIPTDAPVLKAWTWEASYIVGVNWATGRSSGKLISSRLRDAVGPSFLGPDNRPTCGTPAAPIDGCIPIDILGPSGSIDPSARDYIAPSGISSGRDVQHTWLATTHGQIAQLPNNGHLSMAVGADVRRDTGKFIPDPVVPPAGTSAEVRPLVNGSSTALEGFGELSWVPVSGKPLAEWLELDLAARVFHYDALGNGMTWNAGGLFRPIHSLAVRGTYATAFRALSISEQYQRKVGNASGAGAESARTITAGIVFEPRPVPGLTLTGDYWNIETTKALSLGAQIIIENCYKFGIKEYCDAIHRNGSTGEIDFIDGVSGNSDDIATSGVDASVTYDHRITGLGSFREQVEAQYLIDYRVHGFELRDSRSGHPWLRTSLLETWQHPSGAGAGLNLRYIGGHRACSTSVCARDPSLSSDVDGWYRIDLLGSYTFTSVAGKTTLAVGVNNMLDRGPPTIFGASVGDSDPSTYDHVGRLFYARLAQHF